MDQQISAEMKDEIYNLMSTPGVEVNDVLTTINDKFGSKLDYDTLMEFLSDEYYRCNFDHGRRLCCR
jgi:hypothetical protein